MKRRKAFILLVAAILGTGWFWWSRNDPNAREIRRIRTRLADFAVELSYTRGEPLLRRLSYPSRVAAYFADPSRIDVPSEDSQARGNFSRAQLEQIATTYRAALGGLRVQFFDMQIQLLDPRHASAYLTSRIEYAGDRDYGVQEFRLKLIKDRSEWRIQDLESIRTIE